MSPPNNQKCRRCLVVQRLEYTVSKELWEFVIHWFEPDFKDSVCIECFLELLEICLTHKDLNRTIMPEEIRMVAVVGDRIQGVLKQDNRGKLFCPNCNKSFSLEESTVCDKCDRWLVHAPP